MLAPIVLFTYQRLAETRQTVAALQHNFLAPESDLIIFSDGGKDESSWMKVNAVREYLRTINGFKSVQIIESPINKGLANSIISGVTQVLEEYGKIIVLEDDLITSRNFLDFMNQGLDFYKENNRVISISGFSFSIPTNRNYQYDVFFGYRASSWGWGTWKDRWSKIDWDIKSYGEFKYNFIKRLQFNKGGSDMSHMLDNQMSGKINSWAIRFCYHQFENNLVDVYPVKSKVENIGFRYDGTNCHNGSYRFSNSLDLSSKRYFNLEKEIRLNIFQNIKFYWRYSITMRLISKIINLVDNKLNINK
jgi:hypothetical protein